MTKQSHDDIQTTIDALFRRLDAAQTGGELTQCNHALRVQITKKKNQGGVLTEREKELVAAVGTIAGKRSGGHLWIFVLVLAVIGGLYWAYTYLSRHAAS